MRWNRLFVFACLVTLGTSPAMAQEEARLQIEVVRDGSVVAKPQLRMPSGRQGLLRLSDESIANPGPLLKGLRENISITPTIRGDEIALAFTIASGDKQLRPALVISKDVRGSVEWTAADGQPIRLAVTWVQ
jgi:hypothetical protein